MNYKLGQSHNMLASEDLFDKRFEPFEDGYLYYPSRKSGGKLVTSEEYQSLKQDEVRRNSAKAHWKVMLLCLLFAFTYVALEVYFQLPKWTMYPTVAAMMIFIGAPIFWRAYAPNRLVRGREDVTPPRSPSEARKAARALMSWTVVASGLCLGAVALFFSLTNQPSTPGDWVFVLGSGAIFCSYLWTSYAKLKDSKN